MTATHDGGEVVYLYRVDVDRVRVRFYGSPGGRPRETTVLERDLKK